MQRHTAFQTDPLDIDASNSESTPKTISATRLDHDFGRTSVYGNAPANIHGKLRINTPGDVYEREADRVADWVMRMPHAQLQRDSINSGRRAEQPEREHRLLQTTRDQADGSGMTEAPPVVHEVLGSQGRPLDAAARAFFAPRFGQDFSHVRVHTGAAAAQSARAVDASAYTVGRDFVFASGKYSPARIADGGCWHTNSHTSRSRTLTPCCAGL